MTLLWNSNCTHLYAVRELQCHSKDRRVALIRVVLEETLMLPATRVVVPEEASNDLFATPTTSTWTGTDARHREFTAIVTPLSHLGTCRYETGLQQ